MSQAAWPTFTPVADHALLVAFADVISDEASARVVALDRAIAQAPPVGLAECIPAFVNLLIDFDPIVTDHVQVQAEVERLLKTLQAVRFEAALRDVEVCYDADLSPDLDAVARARGLSVDDVIAHHQQGEYEVRMYGFAPGYAYLAGVPEAIQVPRKSTAVRDIPAGSVLIAGPQCLVTTLTMPTGWSIIGRSPTRILTRDAQSPFLFDVGDRVRFKRIDRARYDACMQNDA